MAWPVPGTTVSPLNKNRFHRYSRSAPLTAASELVRSPRVQKYSADRYAIVCAVTRPSGRVQGQEREETARSYCVMILVFVGKDLGLNQVPG